MFPHFRFRSDAVADLMLDLHTQFYLPQISNSVREGGGNLEKERTTLASGVMGSEQCVSDWRRGREASFVRCISLLISFPHWGIEEGEVPGILQRAMDEAGELMMMH